MPTSKRPPNTTRIEIDLPTESLKLFDDYIDHLRQPFHYQISRGSAINYLIVSRLPQILRKSPAGAESGATRPADEDPDFVY
jgi:hypothetical protein